MKKTIITALVAVAAFGFSGTSFAGNGYQNNMPDGEDVMTTIMTSMNTFSPQDNDSWSSTLSNALTTTTTASNATTVTVGDVAAAVATAFAPAYAAVGDLSVATASAIQASSFPSLTTVVTPVVGLGTSVLSDAVGADGFTIGNVNVAGNVGSGVGANIGGAVFESINTATAIAINGTLGTE